MAKQITNQRVALHIRWLASRRLSGRAQELLISSLCCVDGAAPNTLGNLGVQQVRLVRSLRDRSSVGGAKWTSRTPDGTGAGKWEGIDLR